MHSGSEEVPQSTSDIDRIVERLGRARSPFALQMQNIGGVAFACYGNGPATLGAIYERMNRYGDLPFVLGGRKPITYRSMAERAGGVARILARRWKVGRGTHVALALDGVADWITAFLAVTSLGAVAVLIDDKDKLAERCHQTETNLAIITTPKSDQAIIRLTADGLSKPAIIDTRKPAKRLAFSLEMSPDDDAIIAFTSGTTGTPKAAVLTHRSIVSGLQNMMVAAALANAKAGQGAARLKLPPTALVLAPLHHVSGYSQILLAAMMGTRLAFVRTVRPQDIVKAVERYRVTALPGITASQLQDIVTLPSRGNLSSVGSVSINGVAVHGNLIESLRKALPNISIGTGYGLTETSGAICAISGQELADRPRASGRIIPAVSYRVVAEDGSTCRPGDIGDIHLQGAMVMRGYWGAPALSIHGGWLKTGDAGYVSADRHLHIVDRRNNFRAQPPLLEVERATAALLGVAEAAVVAAPEGALTVAIVAARGKTVDCEAIRTQLQEKFFLSHTTLVCVRLPRIPRNKTGKVDAKRLAEQINSIAARQRPVRKKCRLPTSAVLRKTIGTLVKQTHVPGMAMAVCADQKLISAFYGIAARDLHIRVSAASRFEMSCLMKFFVSLITLDLADKNKIDLDASLASLLPDLHGIDKAGRITIRHLLSHTSGYRGLDITDSAVRWNMSWEKFLAFFAATPQLFEPGMAFNYEHSEHVLLGKVLQHITGYRARDLVRSVLFDPLGVGPGRSASDRSDRLPHVANHMLSPTTNSYVPIAMPPFCPFWDASLPDWTITVSDVAKITEAAITGKKPLLSTRVQQWLCEPAARLPDGIASNSQAESVPVSFGLGVAHYADGSIGHNGSMLGQTCGVRINFVEGTVAVAGVNAWSPHARDSALQTALALCQGKKGRAIRRSRKTAPSELARFTGSFSFEQLTGIYIGSYLSEVTVTIEDQNLRFDIGPEGNRRRSFYLCRISDGYYAIRSPSPLSLVFFRDGKTEVPNMMLGVHSYRKIR